MLRFNSANVRIVNSARAAAECLEIAFPDGDHRGCGIIMIKAALGHHLDKLGAAFKALVPDATVMGCSCSGVIGRDGVGESMSDLAVMTVGGEPGEYASASVMGIYGANAYEKGRELAAALKAKAPAAKVVYLLCPGIDIANDLTLKAFDEVFGPETVIFGGTASDNMRGLTNHQYYDGATDEHQAWAVAFSEPGLKAVTRATHGFSAYGSPLTVTRAEGHRILEFDGLPAWPEYLRRLELSPEALCGQSIPIGALAEELAPELGREYGNRHILRVITKFDAEGACYFPVTCREGLKVWLTTRDEDLIFSEQRRSLDFLLKELKGAEPAAVFQTDCLARGRFLFNKVMKDELIGMMHNALGRDEVVPPWLGMYGFGEYARLGGRNAFHNYSTALMALYR